MEEEKKAVSRVIENLDAKKKLNTAKNSVQMWKISSKNAIKDYKEKIAFEKGYKTACIDFELMINDLLKEENNNAN